MESVEQDEREAPERQKYTAVDATVSLFVRDHIRGFGVWQVMSCDQIFIGHEGTDVSTRKEPQQQACQVSKPVGCQPVLGRR